MKGVGEVDPNFALSLLVHLFALRQVFKNCPSGTNAGTEQIMRMAINLTRLRKLEEDAEIIRNEMCEGRSEQQKTFERRIGKHSWFTEEAVSLNCDDS